MELYYLSPKDRDTLNVFSSCPRARLMDVKGLFKKNIVMTPADYLFEI